MSHIDSFKHELVGYLGYLPVYHPLEEIEGDFTCDETQLVLGGGSGEHPALVIENPTATVAFFLKEVIKQEKKLKHWEELIAPYLPYGSDELLSFYEWNIARYSDLDEMSKSVSLRNPIHEESIEDWLILGIGEFIFFSMPELASHLMSQLDDPYKEFYYSRYNNIMVIPPNFPVFSNGGNKFFNKKSE
ncbi:hypothetical protein [Flammeovirga sp. SubArs3]|uniref:hypothetical protein n=1 Tax=Flammeovirga sp. SubArs3 TaxID=2995316 RepID=UPI00248C89AC|nr:hypothetical protein [Flammeovirga sp. SubArs3]